MCRMICRTACEVTAATMQPRGALPRSGSLQLHCYARLQCYINAMRLLSMHCLQSTVAVPTVRMQSELVYVCHTHRICALWKLCRTLKAAVQVWRWHPRLTRRRLGHPGVARRWVQRTLFADPQGASTLSLDIRQVASNVSSWQLHTFADLGATFCSVHEAGIAVSLLRPVSRDGIAVLIVQYSRNED